MRNIYLSSLLLFFVAAVFAQPTCDEPLVIIEDDIENYATGDISFQSPHWDSDTFSGSVSTEQASSGSNSLQFDGNEGNLFLTGGQSSGHYIISFELFIPEGELAFVYCLHGNNGDVAENATSLMSFESEGASLNLYDGRPAIDFDFPNDIWFNVYLFIDIDNDVARLTVNEKAVVAWTFSTGADASSNELQALQFTSLNSVFYVDNVQFSEIPSAEMGQYCYTAEPLTEPGFYAVPELTCWGASIDQGGNGSGFKGYWFSYTPEEDGILSIASCGAGVDTRGWIFSGDDCQNLKIVGVNDDQCDIGNGSQWASYREAVVTAGTQYYIMWDDAWETNEFGFELGLSTEAPEEGEFCQSAQVIGPGDYDINEITGNAAVAGPNINNTTASTTNYAQSKWYQFQPTVDGLMSISSCELAISDTHFYVYTGDCASFEDLNLLTQNDNGCGEGTLTSFLDSIEVTAGTVYYIEWMDRWSDEIFQWTLGFEPTVAVSTVTFSVDMQIEDISPEGVFIAGDFNGWANTPMTDDDGDQIYDITLTLAQGVTYEYKYKNGPDGWEDIDTSVGEDCTQGGYGNRFVEVTDQDVELDPVCFGYCVPCSIPGSSNDLAEHINLQIMPNPVSTTQPLTLTFDAASQINIMEVRLIDAFGRVLSQQNIQDIQTGTLTFNTTALTAGLYQLQIFADGESLTRSVILR
jgi:hypothetical protein